MQQGQLMQPKDGQSIVMIGNELVRLHYILKMQRRANWACRKVACLAP
jgi:hypothetical protein